MGHSATTADVVSRLKNDGIRKKTPDSTNRQVQPPSLFSVARIDQFKPGACRFLLRLSLTPAESRHSKALAHRLPQDVGNHRLLPPLGARRRSVQLQQPHLQVVVDQEVEAEQLKGDERGVLGVHLQPVLHAQQRLRDDAAKLWKDALGKRRSALRGKVLIEGIVPHLVACLVRSVPLLLLLQAVVRDVHGHVRHVVRLVRATRRPQRPLAEQPHVERRRQQRPRTHVELAPTPQKQRTAQVLLRHVHGPRRALAGVHRRRRLSGTLRDDDALPAAPGARLHDPPPLRAAVLRLPAQHRLPLAERLRSQLRSRRRCRRLPRAFPRRQRGVFHRRRCGGVSASQRVRALHEDVRLGQPRRENGAVRTPRRCLLPDAAEHGSLQRDLVRLREVVHQLLAAYHLFAEEVCRVVDLEAVPEQHVVPLAAARALGPPGCPQLPRHLHVNGKVGVELEYPDFAAAFFAAAGHHFFPAHLLTHCSPLCKKRNNEEKKIGHTLPRRTPKANTPEKDRGIETLAVSLLEMCVQYFLCTNEVQIL
eukprot:Rhum_TRINITY_DN13169_c0_g1::Rhum_TRINITY_DN13169_c0_g1_i1::g.57528::m.57528